MSTAEFKITSSSKQVEDDDAPAFEAAITPSNGITPADVASSRGSLAAKLQAKAAELETDRTRRFPVPPHDKWNGALVLVARGIDIKKEIAPLPLIEKVTDHLEFFDEDAAEWQNIGGWAELGELMGITARVSVGEIVMRVCHRKTIIVQGFANDIAEWLLGTGMSVEQALGE